MFYWHLRQDGCIDFKIKLSGELSTNLLSDGEDKPSHGVIVSPGVNAQIHQHMFCVRLDMAVGSHKNTVTEVDVISEPLGDDNPYGNCFNVVRWSPELWPVEACFLPLVHSHCDTLCTFIHKVETVLETEQQAQRVHDGTRARTWKISNAEGILNRITGKPVAYKLYPFTHGPSQPPLLTHPSSAVAKKGAFAQKHLFVTPYDPRERYPAGEYTVQGSGTNGLPDWTKVNRNVKGEDIVLWHAFGVTHVPRPEDFPVMP